MGQDYPLGKILFLYSPLVHRYWGEKGISVSVFKFFLWQTTTGCFFDRNEQRSTARGHVNVYLQFFIRRHIMLSYITINLFWRGPHWINTPLLLWRSNTWYILSFYNMKKQYSYWSLAFEIRHPSPKITCSMHLTKLSILIYIHLLRS